MRWLALALALVACTTSSPTSAQISSRAPNSPSSPEFRGDLTLELLGGGAGLLSAGLLGFGTGLFLWSIQDHRSHLNSNTVAWSVTVGALGALALVPLGVQLAGDRSGGNGRPIYTALGSFVGAALGLSPVYTRLARRERAVVSSIALSAALCVLVGTLQYRLSAERPSTAAVEISTTDATSWSLRIAGAL